MACNHTNINCGCKDSFLTTPAPCPTPEGCPDPQPCSEVFDAQCIVYTGDPIICDQDTVVATNDTVADALNNIVDYVCNQSAGCCPTFVVEIDRSQSLEFGLDTILTNGTAPFTYEWSYAQSTTLDDFRGILLTGPVTNASVNLIVDQTKYYIAEISDVSKRVYSSNIKVKVTDSVGQIAIGYYTETRVLNPPA